VSTENVRLGVCRAIFDGVDLGVTKGGVEVEVTTETHKVMVDQFGQVAVNEFILARDVKVRVPMAETTMENLARVMPGATLTSMGGVRATGSIQLGTNPTANQTVIVNGVSIQFTSSAPSGNQVQLGASAAATATALAQFLQASTDIALVLATYTVNASTVTVTYDEVGTAGNAFTLAAGTSGATVSGATLSGGTNPTKKKVEVQHGAGIDLLAYARRLVLHPVAKPSSDKSEDFIVPLAMTPGAMTYSYKLDEERLFNVEFSAYPNSVTGVLFVIGDESAA
jgi:hypothetical protein